MSSVFLLHLELFSSHSGERAWQVHTWFEPASSFDAILAARTEKKRNKMSQGNMVLASNLSVSLNLPSPASARHDHQAQGRMAHKGPGSGGGGESTYAAAEGCWEENELFFFSSFFR